VRDAVSILRRGQRGDGAHGGLPLKVTDSARFANIVFTIAGIWGVLIITPLYFTMDAVGRASPPPITHPELYYGFVGVTLAWQIGFLIIATNPVRYRTMMLAATLEKFLYVTTIITLAAQYELQAGQAVMVAVPDGMLGLLFAVAFFRTAILADGIPHRSP
jgi:hypothetical protein